MNDETLSDGCKNEHTPATNENCEMAPSMATPVSTGVVLPGVWPGHVDTQGLEVASPLSDEQDARSTALYHARGVLERRGGVMAGNASTPPSVGDLLRVARFILDGGQP